MDNLIAKALYIAKKANPLNLRQLSRKQAVKLVAGIIAAYIAIVAVNAVILASQIDSSDVKTDGLRSRLDFISLNLNLGSQMTDTDLRSQQAIARVGAYYLKEDRFIQLSTTEAAFRRSINKPIDESNSKFFADYVVDRMLVEQLVGQFARDNNLEVDQRIVEIRIAQNMRKFGGLKQLEKSLKQQYNWTLSDFRYEIEFSVLRAKMEESLGGEKYAEAARQGFQRTDSPKVRDYADAYARNHNNYLVSGGYDTLARRILEL